MTPSLPRAALSAREDGNGNLLDDDSSLLGRKVPCERDGSTVNTAKACI